MKALNDKGFKNTCVVGYLEDIFISKEDFTILDFSVKSRANNDILKKQEESGYNEAIKLGKQQGFYDRRKNVLENKKVCHNYTGVIVAEYYKNFKKKYLLPSLEEKEKKEQLVLLIAKLKIYILLYIESSQQKDHGFFHFHHKHGRSGQDRARYILNSLNNIIKHAVETLINSDISSSDFEIQLIKELKAFAAKTGNYRNFSGGINVYNNSCLSYILRALNEFYSNYSCSIQSNILKEFAKYLSQCRIEISPTTIFSRGQFDNEEERRRLKNRLIALQDNIINSWYSSIN